MSELYEKDLVMTYYTCCYFTLVLFYELRNPIHPALTLYLHSVMFVYPWDSSASFLRSPKFRVLIGKLQQYCGVNSPVMLIESLLEQTLDRFLSLLLGPSVHFLVKPRISKNLAKLF